MKITVMGAGAVGCYYGGLLARAGHEVTMIGRANHVEAMEQGGLRIQTQKFDETVQVAASTDPAAVAGAELVLFCVKSPATEEAGEALKPYLGLDTLVLTLQNGVDNADRLRQVIGQEVIATVVYVATEMAGPGHVLHRGRGELVIGNGPRSEAIATLLREAGIPTDVSDDVRGALWAKLILNCAHNAMSAITQLPYGRLVEGVEVNNVLDDVVRECLAVAHAGGVTVPGDMNAAVRHIVQTMPGQYSSTAQDLARNKPTEIDYLNGLIVRQGRVHGIPTPANRVLFALVKAIESKQAGASPAAP